ncbi:MAG: hypothetical protein EHM48_00710 [Planctomycetaceae bacterium]|nr:MAG: hypothetical protein EHM48_00710 [Planctomycetaceae bacterium]
MKTQKTTFSFPAGTTKFDRCEIWLSDYLRKSPAPVKPMDVITAGENAGYCKAMIYRAHQSLQDHIYNTEGKKAPSNFWVWKE